MKTSRIKSSKEALRTIAQGLRSSAQRPNIYSYKPHDKQLPFHAANTKGRQFLGGNRSGKTTAGTCESIWWATGTHPYRITPNPPVRGRVVVVDFLNGLDKIVLPEFARWCPLSKLKGNSWTTAWDREHKVLTFENESFIEFMSHEQDLDKFGGTSRNFIWFDEDPPEDIYKECMARLIDTGGHWWFTMTPVEGMSSFTYDEIYLRAKTDPTITVVEVDMTENPYLNPAEIDSFLATLREDEKKARVHGTYIRVGGLIYDKAFTNKNVIDPFIPPKEWMHFCAMDHGFNNPTCFLWMAVNNDGRVVVYDEHYESGHLIDYHARRVHEINKTLGVLPSYYVGDPSIRNIDPITGTSIHLEYIEHGIPIVLGNNDQRAGILRVARHFQGINGTPQLYITRNCVNLLWEIPRLRWARWQMRKVQNDKNKKEEQHKKDDHACDALRYGIASRPQADDGKEMPEFIMPEGASTVINPFRRIDEEVATSGRQTYHDMYLGDDW